jgi:hypothetical protein
VASLPTICSSPYQVSVWTNSGACVTAAPTSHTVHFPCRPVGDPLRLVLWQARYEAAGLSRSLSKAPMAERSPADFVRSSKPAWWAHRQRCPDRRPKLSLADRVRAQ